MIHKTDDLRIIDVREVVPYAELQVEFPITRKAAQTTHDTRQAIHRILHGEDDRMLVIVGPCSIHDPNAALEYAGRGIRGIWFCGSPMTLSSVSTLHAPRNGL